MENELNLMLVATIMICLPIMTIGLTYRVILVFSTVGKDFSSLIPSIVIFAGMLWVSSMVISPDTVSVMFRAVIENIGLIFIAFLLGFGLVMFAIFYRPQMSLKHFFNAVKSNNLHNVVNDLLQKKNEG